MKTVIFLVQQNNIILRQKKNNNPLLQQITFNQMELVSQPFQNILQETQYIYW